MNVVEMDVVLKVVMVFQKKCPANWNASGIEVQMLTKWSDSEAYGIEMHLVTMWSGIVMSLVSKSVWYWNLSSVFQFYVIEMDVVLNLLKYIFKIVLKLEYVHVF